MSKEVDQKTRELAALALTRVGDDGVVEIASDDQGLMSQASYFRALSSLRAEDVLGLVKKGVYKTVVPPRMLRSRAFKAHLRMAGAALDLLENVESFRGEYFGGFYEFVLAKRDACLACEHYLECMEGGTPECPQDSAPPSGEALERLAQIGERYSQVIVSGESHISEEEEKEDPDLELSRESFPPKRSGTEAGGCPAPRPQTDPKSLIRRSLAQSKAAAESKPPTMRAQLRDLKEVWDAELKKVHGDDFRPPKWGGKENKNFPSAIKNYGLELTKRAVLLYFREWSNIKAENAWIDAPTPTTGLFLHFQDRLFAAAQGRGQVVGERASKRTADEPDYEAEDGQDIGQWPEEEAPHEA